ncbi:MAG: phosphate starvation-inducible protein PhoH, partial [Deltaproteobacteria bacterium]|nr:phosphate starvation-inducible protein PhoH [Deltaproteobacteria bacterium]
MTQKNDRISVREISFSDINTLRSLFGEHDRNIKLIEKLASVKLTLRGNLLSIKGEQLAVDLIQNLV